MEIYTVYIPYSQKYDNTYFGFISNLISRYKSHNHLATKGYTIKFIPWKDIYCEYYQTKKEVLSREKHLKSGIGRSFVKGNNNHWKKLLLKVYFTNNETPCHSIDLTSLSISQILNNSFYNSSIKASFLNNNF